MPAECSFGLRKLWADFLSLATLFSSELNSNDWVHLLSRSDAEKLKNEHVGTYLQDLVFKHVGFTMYSFESFKI